MRRDIIKTDKFLFFLLLSFSLVINYFFPRIVSYLFFFSLLLLFYRSKNDYFWFAFILFLTDAPGWLFPIGDPTYGLPMINLGFFLSYQEIFIYLALVKAFSSKYKGLTYYKSVLIALLAYSLILLMLSLAQGTSMLIFTNSIKWLLPWSLLYSIPRLINNEQSWTNFFKLLFPLLFFSLSAQLFQLFTGHSFGQLFGGTRGLIDESSLLAENGIFYDRIFEVYRLMGSFYIVLLTFIASMFYLCMKNPPFKKNYLFLILFISYFSVLLSATRGWIIAFSLVLFIYFIFIYKGFKPLISFSFFGIPIILIILLIPQMSNQLEGVSNRMSTVELMSEGDLSAGGTLDRYTKYTPDLINIFLKSPIVGWGFSSTYWNNMNEHAGTPNLLMQMGILGFILVLIFWWQMFFLPLRFSRYFLPNNPYKKSISVLAIGFLILFLIHNSSGQLFFLLIGYYGRSFAIIIFIAFSSFYLKESKKCDIYLRQQLYKSPLNNYN